MDGIVPIKCVKSESTSSLSRVLLFSIPFPGLLDAESVRCTAVSSHSICIQWFFFFVWSLIRGCDKTQTCVSFQQPPGGPRRCPCCPRWTTRSWRRTWWKGRTGCAPCCSRRCAGWVCHFTSSQWQLFSSVRLLCQKKQHRHALPGFCRDGVRAFQRLTRSLPGEQRDTVLQAYISNDLLELHDAKQVGSHERGEMSPSVEMSDGEFSFSCPFGLLCLFHKEVRNYLKRTHNLDWKENVYMMDVAALGLWGGSKR